MIADHAFDEKQTQYLQGFVAGADAARTARGLPGLAQAMQGLQPPVPPTPVALTVSAAAAAPDAIHVEAQDRFLAQGRKLTKEETAKRQRHGLDTWDLVAANAEAGVFPKGTDVFLTKFQGMFYVAPAQDSFMCRLRFPGGIVTPIQFRGVADLAERYGGGYSDVTTRANLQIREIGPKDPLNVLMGLQDLGIVNRGAGADNVRNITASPTAGIDPRELYDTRPLARQMHHYILNHRELYGLPRKFNIAFEGGGFVSALAETNDIGFFAVRVPPEHATGDVPPNIYFRMELGGITGHKDFSRDTGVLLRPEQCVPVAAAAVRAFMEHGDRTDRNKARLKYLLDAWGFDRFMAEVEKKLGAPLPRFPAENCLRPEPADPLAHIGVHPQKQPGKNYIGVVLPVGRLSCEQMRVIADLAQRCGGSSSSVRLTVWQNLLISDVSDHMVETVKRELRDAGLSCDAHTIRAGLVACTGNAGCKFAAANTKAHALAIADHIEPRLELDQPINIHLTGCHHSCAQHYIGDIGLIATKVTRGEDMVEGYHLHVGGGHGEHRDIGRELYRDVTAEELPGVVEQLLRVYQQRREGDKSFREFTRRQAIESLRAMFEVPQPLQV